jgi:hypothetical protein
MLELSSSSNPFLEKCQDMHVRSDQAVTLLITHFYCQMTLTGTRYSIDGSTKSIVVQTKTGSERCNNHLINLFHHNLLPI